MSYDTFIRTASGMTDLLTGFPWDAAHLYGYPWRGNTGPTGPLTPVGPQVITEPDTVLEDLDITGDVFFEETATGGIMRNCRVTSNGFWPCRFYGVGGLVEDSEIIGSDNSQASLVMRRGTARRVDLHGAGDGARLEFAGVLEDSYLHDFADFEGAHNDALELLPGGALDAGFTITGNSILNRIGQTSAIIMSDWGDNPDAATLITGNLLAGGVYTIYGATVTDDVQGIEVVGNAFSTMFFPECGAESWLAYWPGAGNTWSGNTWIDGPNVGDTVPIA
jgi:hypothetical protein